MRRNITMGPARGVRVKVLGARGSTPGCPGRTGCRGARLKITLVQKRTNLDRISLPFRAPKLDRCRANGLFEDAVEVGATREAGELPDALHAEVGAAEQLLGTLDFRSRLTYCSRVIRSRRLNSWQKCRAQSPRCARPRVSSPVLQSADR